MIDVVCTDRCAHKLLHEIVFFVGATGGRQSGDGIAAVLALDIAQLAGDQIQRLVPADPDEFLGAAQFVGGARPAFEEALDYSKQRVQFGQPIIMNQGISFMLTDMLMKIMAGRNLYYNAGWLAMKAAEGDKASAAKISTASSIAKAFCGDMAMEVTTNAVQVLGGYGYMKDYPVEKYMRDAKIMQIYEGTSQIQRVVLVANMMGMKELKQG